MKLNDISNLRLINQQIEGSKFKTAKEVAGWMCALQAQDYNMSKWAIGKRLPDSTEKSVEQAIDRGEIIRTHLLRPTWHFVSSDDIYWLTDLTARQIRESFKSRERQLGLTEAIFRKSNSVIEKALVGGNHLTRDEIMAELTGAGIPVDNNRASHLLARAEIEGLICSGKTKAHKLTYAILSERVKRTRILSRDEALAELARKYFTSHGPATLSDFTWWSGLSVSESRKALETVKSDFISETTGEQTYWFSSSISSSAPERDSVHFLPAYDEFIISYKDRKAFLPFEDQNRIVSNNGIFRPVIVQNGQVTGIWKRTTNKDKLIIGILSLQSHGSADKSRIEKAVAQYGRFIGKLVELSPYM
jgi:hypothetical protein